MWDNIPNVTQHPECDSTSRMWLNIPNVTQHPELWLKIRMWHPESECNPTPHMWCHIPNVTDSSTKQDYLLWQIHLPNRITYFERLHLPNGITTNCDRFIYQKWLPIVTDSYTESKFVHWKWLPILNMKQHPEYHATSQMWRNTLNMMQQPECDATTWIWCNSWTLQKWLNTLIQVGIQL